MNDIDSKHGIQLLNLYSIPTDYIWYATGITAEAFIA